MTDQIAYRDRDYEFSAYIQTDAGVAIDITGSTWSFTLRRNNVETVLVTAVPSIGSASGGRLDIAILAASMTFDGGRLVAELVRTDTGADTYARWYVSFGNPGQIVGGSGDITVRPSANMVIRAVNAPAGPAGAGAGVMTNFTATAWRVFYSDGSGDVTELALGADGTFLKSNGAAVAPSFATPAGSGDVAKVGTPANNQIGIWTGDGTLEGDAGLTFDSTSDTLTIAASGNLAFGAVTILDDSAGTMTLSNIDALDATTLATILAGLLTVDGAGSGLDADTLDGNSSAFFATASQFSTLTAGVSASFDTLLEIETALSGKASTSHSHAASDITSGSLVHERGGLEADVSAYSGFVKITGGVTSAVAVTANGESLITAANYAAMKALLDLEIGTDVQAQDAELAAIAGLTSAADKGIQFTGSGAAATYDLTAAGKALLDDANAAAQRTTLGLGTSATMDEATDAQVRAATADKVITAELIESASAPVALTDAATIALDWDSGINFTVTLGGNRTLGNPTNEQVGTWRRVQVTQDGTGSRTLALDTEYVTVGDAAITLTTAAGSVDVLMIYCRSATVFEVYASLNVK